MNTITWNEDTGCFEYSGRYTYWKKEINHLFSQRENNQAVCHRISFKTIAAGILNALHYFDFYLSQKGLGNENRKLSDEDIVLFSKSFLAGMILSVKGIKIDESITGQIMYERSIREDIRDNGSTYSQEDLSAKEAEIYELTKQYCQELVALACMDVKYSRILNRAEHTMNMALQCYLPEDRTEFIQKLPEFFQILLKQEYYPIDEIVHLFQTIVRLPYVMPLQEDYIKGIINDLFSFLSDGDDTKSWQVFAQKKKRGLHEMSQSIYECEDEVPILQFMSQLEYDTHLFLFDLQSQDIGERKKVAEIIESWETGEEAPPSDVYDYAVQVKGCQCALEYSSAIEKLIDIISVLKIQDENKKELFFFIIDQLNNKDFSDRLFVYPENSGNVNYHIYMSDLALQASKLIDELNNESVNLKLGVSKWNASLQDAYDCESSAYKGALGNEDFFLYAETDSIQLSNLMNITLGYDENIIKNGRILPQTSLYLCLGMCDDLKFVYSSNLPIEYGSKVDSVQKSAIQYRDYFDKNKYKAINYEFIELEQNEEEEE